VRELLGLEPVNWLAKKVDEDGVAMLDVMMMPIG